eukprot:5426928-Pyramimonas_sp.AAC.1
MHGSEPVMAMGWHDPSTSVKAPQSSWKPGESSLLAYPGDTPCDGNPSVILLWPRHTIGCPCHVIRLIGEIAAYRQVN